MVHDNQRFNMILRILSALVIGTLFIVSIIFFKLLFNIIMLLVAACMLYEWYEITKSSVLHLLLGLIIIPPSIISLMLINVKEGGQGLLLLYFCIIWSVDSFAMIGGKNFGGPKLAPNISPNKTWSGLIVGIVSATLITLLLSIIMSNFNIDNYYFSNKIYLIITSFYLALISQMSDLFISYFKRKFNVKDSGKIIPGHGGVLDRFDSIILTAPILFFIISIV